MVSMETDALELVRMMKAIIITSILAFLIPQVHVKEPMQVHPAPKYEVIYAEPVEVEIPAKIEAVAKVEEPKPEPKPVASGDCAAEIYKYDWNHTVALNVARAESGLRPGAVNDNPRTKDYSIGCFQINLYGANARTRPSEAHLKNAANNVAFAYKIYVANGRSFKGQWGVCRIIYCY